MPKKKEIILDVRDYVSTQEAAHILSVANSRPIRTDYLPHIRLSKKHHVRYIQSGRNYLYHREDLAQCMITEISGQSPLRPRSPVPMTPILEIEQEGASYSC